ncbi:uncharacterized protein EV154DRAFT_481107 [Mucor mucedo]|uniref:uncharacterized protein n=1 Tax=Mucor mucedo TaxID=29922 RepID=UPI00221F51BF|nr:uncharacterized protein EV154DRAFT_481107 [Mucor mucedo]KAI7891680.1 hypothetical protein EV154DRAFT_481107 [Mucor mucedo]
MKRPDPHDEERREHELTTLLNEEKKESILMRSDLNQDRQFYVKGRLALYAIEAHKLGNTLDDLILQLIAEETNTIHIFQKWERFSNKNGKHNYSMDDFRSSLSSKQIPTVVILIVKAKIEAKCLGAMR